MNIKDEFHNLTREWIEETVILSYHDQNHPTLRKIIDRKDFLPFIIESMRKKEYLCWQFEVIDEMLGDKPEIPEHLYGNHNEILIIYDKWLKAKGM